MTELFSFSSMLTRLYKSKMRIDPLSNMETRAAPTDQVSQLIEHTGESYEGCEACEAGEAAEYEDREVAIYNVLEQRNSAVLEHMIGEQEAAAQYARAVAEYARAVMEHDLAGRHVRASGARKTAKLKALEQHARSSAEFGIAKRYARAAKNHKAAGQYALAITEQEIAEQHTYVHRKLEEVIYYTRKSARYEVAEEYARQAGLHDLCEQNARKAMEYKTAEYRAREETTPQGVKRYGRKLVRHIALDSQRSLSLKGIHARWEEVRTGRSRTSTPLN
jgi:hypothetical protein